MDLGFAMEPAPGSHQDALRYFETTFRTGSHGFDLLKDAQQTILFSGGKNMFFLLSDYVFGGYFVNDFSVFLLQIDPNWFAAGPGSLWHIPDPLLVVGSDASLS